MGARGRLAAPLRSVHARRRSTPFAVVFHGWRPRLAARRAPGAARALPVEGSAQRLAHVPAARAGVVARWGGLGGRKRQR